MSWFFACWCNIFWLDQHYTLYFWLLNASPLQMYLLDPWRYLEGSYEIWFVCPSILGCDWLFSWGWIIRFLLIWTWCQIFWKNFFAQKLGRWVKNRVFFNLNKNLIINFHWIYSIKKFFILCCVFAQVLYLV